MFAFIYVFNFFQEFFIVLIVQFFTSLVKLITNILFFLMLL